MACRANITNLKPFASKLGCYHINCVDVKLILKEVARGNKCVHTDLQTKSVYFMGFCTIWDIMELLQVHSLSAGYMAQMPKHPMRHLLFVNLQRQFSSWQPDGNSDTAKE